MSQRQVVFFERNKSLCLLGKNDHYSLNDYLSLHYRRLLKNFASIPHPPARLMDESDPLLQQQNSYHIPQSPPQQQQQLSTLEAVQLAALGAGFLVVALLALFLLAKVLSCLIRIGGVVRFVLLNWLATLALLALLYSISQHSASLRAFLSASKSAVENVQQYTPKIGLDDLRNNFSAHSKPTIDGATIVLSRLVTLWNYVFDNALSEHISMLINKAVH
jgi:hypothetical protein